MDVSATKKYEFAFSFDENSIENILSEMNQIIVDHLKRDEAKKIQYLIELKHLMQLSLNNAR